MIKTKFFTSACISNERNRIADIRFFYALVREQVKERFEHPKYKNTPKDVVENWMNHIISIHEHNRHFTITITKGTSIHLYCFKVWEQMGERSHIHFVRDDKPYTYGDFLLLEQKLMGKRAK